MDYQMVQEDCFYLMVKSFMENLEMDNIGTETSFTITLVK